jgi:hypothetical protein
MVLEGRSIAEAVVVRRRNRIEPANGEHANCAKGMVEKINLDHMGSLLPHGIDRFSRGRLRSTICFLDQASPSGWVPLCTMDSNTTALCVVMTMFEA